jgi:hypothetical protein
MEEMTDQRLPVPCRGVVMSEAVQESAFAVELPTPELPKGEREYQAFLRLLPELLATHWGMHVAVHNGQVVDSDPDDVALILRVQAKIGYVPIHVGLVTDSPPLVRFPHYRELRTRGDSGVEKLDADYLESVSGIMS